MLCCLVQIDAGNFQLRSNRLLKAAHRNGARCVGWGNLLIFWLCLLNVVLYDGLSLWSWMLPGYPLVEGRLFGLYVFPLGGENCTCLWCSFSKNMQVQFSDPEDWEMFDIPLNCAEVCAHACSFFWTSNTQFSLTWFHLLLVCVYQDWSIDLNRTLSKREKKKPSEGVTLTGINQTGSDQPVQPAQSSSR